MFRIPPENGGSIHLREQRQTQGRAAVRDQVDVFHGPFRLDGLVQGGGVPILLQRPAFHPDDRNADFQRDGIRVEREALGTGGLDSEPGERFRTSA